MARSSTSVSNDIAEPRPRLSALAAENGSARPLSIGPAGYRQVSISMLNAKDLSMWPKCSTQFMQREAPEMPPSLAGLADISGRPRQRRILMTADTVGGVWTYALELARALEPHGIDITLATMGPRATVHQKEDAAQIANLTLVESDFKLEWMEEPWRDVADAGFWLLELERTVEPDLVHLNGYAHAALPWNSPVMVVAHSCVASWWQAVKQTRLPAAW